MEEIEVQEEKKYKYVVSVKFKNNSKPYSFGYDFEDIEYGDYVVVETARGIELGELVSPLRLYEQFPTPYPLKPVVRKADAVDRNQYEQNLYKAKEALAFCEEQVAALGLQMNLISAEYTLDRAKVLFVYLADERVDFRELLKVLAQHLHCRIELKQIGARDKAKLVGGIGMCGRECCCSRFLNSFDVVSINMAKNQLLALNVAKLSGVCGKLMCCLKYEDAAYKELTKGLPKMNAAIEYEGERYRVTSMNVISNQAKLENKENTIFITLDELMEKGIVKKGEPVKKEEIPEELKKLEDVAPKPEKPIKKEVRKPRHEFKPTQTEISDELKSNKNTKPGFENKRQDNKNHERKNDHKPHDKHEFKNDRKNEHKNNEHHNNRPNKDRRNQQNAPKVDDGTVRTVRKFVAKNKKEN